ncbi:MAG: hypothetical protein EOO73_12490 [Myxococcales bacterium]|nr:MAG: hypothetical protein EOO73_12490 [Myxococcales bacterium]
MLRRRDCCSALLALAVVTGCEEDAADSEPERLVAELIARLQRVHGDRKAARAAYELLWSDARRNLAERAKRASDVAGREIAPEEMLPPSRFALHRKPRHYEARIDGDWAEVSITSEGGAVDRVKCVREDGKWRVVLELPPLTPIERRLDGGL